MIGKRKDRKSTRQFSIKEKEQIISDFKSSGLSAREFALTIDVASATLGRWVKAYDKGKLEKPKKIKRGGPYSIHDRKQAIEAYYKSGMNQHDFAKTWGCSEITLNRWISQYKKYGINEEWVSNKYQYYSSQLNNIDELLDDANKLESLMFKIKRNLIFG